MYNLAQDDKKNYRDMFIKHALKEFDETFDYECCDKKKLLNLEECIILCWNLYPSERKQSIKEHYFNNCMEKAIHAVFKRFDVVKPLSRDKVNS